MGNTRLQLMAFFARIWYTISQFFTGFGGASVEHYDTPREIAAALLQGTRYRADRRMGAMLHAHKFQARMDAGKRLGDCEDHVAYWATALYGSSLARELYLGSVFYKDETGKKRGHAVIIFRDLRYQEYFWADYRDPERIPTKDSWIEPVLRKYGGKLRGAYMHRIEPTGVRGQLRLGKVTTFPLHKR